MSNKIFPLAYHLLPDQVQTLYYLGFPKEWKLELLEIAKKAKPGFRDEYGLPTNALKKLVDGWLEGIIALSPLKKGSNDEHWLTSCFPFSETQLKALCGLIEVWLHGTYVTPKAPALVKDKVRSFCTRLRPDAFRPLQREAAICLTNPDGTVCEPAYQAIPLLAVNALLGKSLSLNGQLLHLCYSGKNQLMTQPITDPDSHHQYSLVFDLSVQTTPPQRHALLLCHMSTRRWIFDMGEKYKGRVPYLSPGIQAHIQVAEDKYCKVNIAYERSGKQPDWKRQDKQCYNLFQFQPLPPAQDVLTAPSDHAPGILLPYKNGRFAYEKSRIGTGVSILDKKELYQGIASRLTDYISAEIPEAIRVSSNRNNFKVFRSPKEYPSPEEFRRWVRQCAETDKITFELYGLWQDENQSALLNQLRGKLEEDFGPDTPDSCMEIQIVPKETGSLADALENDERKTKITRCGTLVKQIGPADGVTACLFVLPGKESYKTGDPKICLRNAFARTGRVVQFVTPGDESDHKVTHAVYDLYRQLGVVTLLNRERLPIHSDVPCVGMHLCKQVKGISNKGRFLPVYITVNVPEGRTRVQCSAFPDREVSYRQACLELAKLFWCSDLEERCVNASRSPAKQKLIELKNRYDTPEKGVVLVAAADGDSRVLWSGLSDKEIGQYPLSEEYCPTNINAGSSKNPIPFSLKGTGIRLIRMRCNQEVPDYYTSLSLSQNHMDENPKMKTSSGVFQYEKVFWSIQIRSKDREYINSTMQSRISNPASHFAEKDMVELYPIQLQSGDKAKEWIFYVNALSKIPIQYNLSTTLPLPLHLGKALEEYLFDPD